MELSNIVSMIGAVALFLFGMNTMSSGLERLSSGRLESILERLTDSVWKGVLLGALVTGLIQSSGATTVMCVGFVNAGIMKLGQTVGIIMGANIGTTVTAQLLRLGDISSDNVVLALLKPSMLGPVLAVVGVIFYMFVKRGHRGTVGQILLGLGVLFIGMDKMTEAVAPLQGMPEFQAMFSAFSNPFLGILVGAGVTALLQSSSASMGILQTVATTGAVRFNTAVPLIMGQNIGSCITAMLSAIGASRNAKRTAGIHLLFNLLGTAFFMVVLYGGNTLFSFPFWNETMNMGSVANLHLAFNIGCTLLLLPFNKLLVKLVKRIVPGDKEEQEMSILDERFLTASPALALEKSHEAVIQMGTYARENYKRSMELLAHFDQRGMDRLQETEDVIDKLETNLDNYLVRLSDVSLSPEDSNKVSELLHTLSDFERIGDYVVNVAECAQAMDERNITFSGSAKQELDTLTAAVGQIIDLALECYTKRDGTVATRVEPLEEVIDLMRDELRNRHIERLKSGECTIEVGTQFLELLINLERVADHCSNIAMYILREGAKEGDPVRENAHVYLHQLHEGGSDANFDQLYSQFKKQYYETLERSDTEGETPPMFREEPDQG